MAAQKLSWVKREMILSELHSLLGSGLDFNSAFKLLIDSEADPKTRAMLQELYAAIVRGDSLWRAFEKSGKFSALDYGVIRVGEETGRIEESLAFVSEYYRSMIAQRRMVVGAVSYPLIIMATALIVMVFMIAVIVPMFEQVYTRMGSELPAITQAIINLSRSFFYYAGAFCVVVVAVIAYFRIGRNTPHVQQLSSQIILRTPLIGTLIRKSTQARFCKLLDLLYSSGVPLLNGIEMLKTIITFYPYRRSFDSICEGLNRGESIAEVMQGYSTIYDRKLVVLIRVGEQTNRLGLMLRKQGEDITQELEHRLRQIGNTLEPLLILFVGVIVAVILIAMYLPMFKIGEVIK